MALLFGIRSSDWRFLAWRRQQLFMPSFILALGFIWCMGAVVQRLWEEEASGQAGDTLAT